MSEIAVALYAFWSQFGIPAGMSDTGIKEDINGVSAHIDPPYLLYQVQNGELFGEMTDYVQIFYAGQNKSALYATADAISDAVGDAVTIPLPSGRILVIDEITWTDKPDTENTVAVYGSFTIHY